MRAFVCACMNLSYENSKCLVVYTVSPTTQAQTDEASAIVALSKYENNTRRESAV